ncbi:hypothetical protein [Paraliobacillus sp. JSM ZJ581]|uniref:hypothetical protein n=1 Tax=Paraliobacillus sp. JSM ZJ581 TaxID=3342118 RepID=UPI0035A84CD8
MKGFVKFIFLNFAMVALISMLAGCANETKETEPADVEEAEDQKEMNNNESEPKEEDSNDNSVEEPVSENKNGSTDEGTESARSNNETKTTENITLSSYSSEKIEYARVWLQLGKTQDIDELNVEHISVGKPLNPDDETSINYPENVIRLTGSRLVEGSITYSGNGDGTINLYNRIPQRWDGENPAGEDVYKTIIEDIEQKSIDPGNDEEIINLIDKLHIY